MKTRYIVLDTETTGLGKEDWILQLAYETYDQNCAKLGHFTGYFEPLQGYEIHEKAFEVHGITKGIHC